MLLFPPPVTAALTKGRGITKKGIHFVANSADLSNFSLFFLCISMCSGHVRPSETFKTHVHHMEHTNVLADSEVLVSLSAHMCFWLAKERQPLWILIE